MDVNIKNAINNKILEMIDEDKIDRSKKINILDGSYNNSELLFKLKDRYENVNMYRLEINTINEEQTILYEEGYFDYIILHDTLQKYINPWETLKVFKKYLKKDGFIISSIPNLMHISIISQIINGRFNYTNDGTLDKHNLRFFTLEEIQSLFEESGYDIKLLESIIINPDKNTQNFIDFISPIYNENIRFTFNIYQYILKTRLKESKTLFDYVKRLD